MSWDRIRSSYDRVARTYERTFRDELQDKPWDQQRIAAFCADVAGPVVDVGCGPGQVGAYARRVAPYVVGVDLSSQMARLAARRLDAAVVGDLRRLPLADQSVGGVLAFYAVIHLRRPELGAAFREFRRVLEPRGRVLVSAHEGEGELTSDEFLGEPVPFVATLFRLDELSAAVEAAGLDVVHADRRPPYPAEHPTVRLYVEAVRTTE
jgi:ubiquinone/menaquinone biosynthesis C-methylase UbiE